MMPLELVSILVLVVVFLLATLLPVNMGALAFVAVFVFGGLVVGEEVPDEVLADFPADLFIILVGVTYLFAIAKNNGTVDWLVQAAVRLVRGRVALIPWVMFVVISILTAFGAVVPAAVAIIAPVGLSLARRHGISPVLMSLLIINGASAGGFSPISIFGAITNGVVARSGLPGSPLGLFVSSYVINALLSVAVFLLFGGRQLLNRRIETDEAETERDGPRPDDPDFDESVLREERRRESSTREDGPTSSVISSRIGTGSPGGAVRQKARRADSPDVLDERIDLDRSRVLTLVAIVGTALASFTFGLDIGVVAITAAVLLSLVSGEANKAAVAQIAWPTVLLITGIVTYVGLMQRIGTIDWLGNQVAGIGVPLLAALVICLIGAAVSAFASTTGILAALIPLAVPFLLGGQIGAVGMIIALALSSSIVDSSPFSTSGALCVANSLEEQRDLVYRRLLQWGMSMIVVAPLITWTVFVLPGWL
jgi:di/tricarboxylate transporter